MNQLSFDFGSAVPTPKPVIRLERWEKHHKGWKGEFTIFGERQRKKGIERDYQCDIYRPDGKWETYLETIGYTQFAIEKEFYDTVDANHLALSSVEVGNKFDNDVPPSGDASGGDSIQESRYSHWIENYAPPNRKTTYYRYCYRDRTTGKKKHLHIPGGGSKSRLANYRKELICEAIALGKSPQEIIPLLRKPRPKQLVVSLFCGIGGFDLGFEAAGFEIAIAIDNNPQVLELYKLNFPNTLAVCRDIADITAAEIREAMSAKYPLWDGEIAAVIGGPPCQGFSMAGKQDPSDARSGGVLKFINLAVELNPTFFVMENVPAIASPKFAHIVESAIAQIPSDYTLSKWLLTASDYGVPQKRRRMIWVGSKLGEVTAPIETEQRVCVGDAIADLECLILNNQEVQEIKQVSDYSKRLGQVFSRQHGNKISGLQISGLQLTNHAPDTQEKYINTIPGKKESTTWAYRLSAGGLSPTLRAGSGSHTATRPIHYNYARVITVREAARLHSFPDWFEFGASKLAAHRAIGNSVPPLLSYALAQCLQVLNHIECR